MSTLPGSIIEDIEWFEQRLPNWTEDPTSIGLTAAQITQLTAETQQARTAYNAVLAAKVVAKDATANQGAQVAEMRTFGSQMIKTIRAFALTQPNPAAVLAAASVPEPQVPGSIPPEQPYDIDFDLTDAGAISLKWKGSTLGGTVFTVSRSVRIDPNQPFGPAEQVAIVGNREFVDATVPACSIAAAYTITAYKGTFPPVASKVATVLFTPGGESAGQQLSIAA